MENEYDTRDDAENKKFEDLLEDTFGFEFKTAHLSRVVLPQEYLEKIDKYFKKPRGLLYFAGNPGLGKTYICAAFARDCLEKNYSWRAYKEKDLLSHLRLLIETVDYTYELKRLCDCPFFFLDDLGTAKDSPWKQEVMFDFIDTRWSSGKPTLITSNLSVDNLKKFYGERTVSRIKDRRNTVIELDWIDKRIEGL